MKNTLWVEISFIGINISIGDKNEIYPTQSEKHYDN